MGVLAGLDNYTTTGNASVAVIAGAGASIAIKDLETDADASKLKVLLTKDGDLSQRTKELGSISGTGTHSIDLPDNVNISVYNTLLLISGDTAIGSALIP